jgi:hypothetical protein
MVLGALEVMIMYALREGVHRREHLRKLSLRQPQEENVRIAVNLAPRLTNAKSLRRHFLSS